MPKFTKKNQNKTVKSQAPQNEKERKELEAKVLKGAKEVLKDYRRVFERLADYDRT